MMKDTGRIIFSATVIDNQESYRKWFSSMQTEEEKQNNILHLKGIQDFRQTGIFQTSDKNSPLYDATFEVMGSVAISANGEKSVAVMVFAIIDPKGNPCWGHTSIDYEGGETTVSYSPRAGLAGLKDLQGVLTHEIPVNQSLYDQHAVVDYKFEYEFKPHVPVAHMRNSYKNKGKGYSLHGAHIKWFAKPLCGEYEMELNHQEGVVVTDDPNCPLFNTRYFGKSFRFKYNDTHKALSDCMPNRYVDNEGNIIWLVGQWWYGDHIGCDHLIAATGKWKNTKLYLFYDGTKIGVDARADNAFVCHFEYEYE